MKGAYEGGRAAIQFDSTRPNLTEHDLIADRVIFGNDSFVDSSLTIPSPVHQNTPLDIFAMTIAEALCRYRKHTRNSGT